MSVAQSDDVDLGTTGHHEHSISHLVLTQRKLLEERSNSLISHIQSLSGLENFLKTPSFDVLNSAALNGPIIIINQSQVEFPSHIIILYKDLPSIISTPSSFYDHANRLHQ